MVCLIKDNMIYSIKKHFCLRQPKKRKLYEEIQFLFPQRGLKKLFLTHCYKNKGFTEFDPKCIHFIYL